jgi:hypothetical protein
MAFPTLSDPGSEFLKRLSKGFSLPFGLAQQMQDEP